VNEVKVDVEQRRFAVRTGNQVPLPYLVEEPPVLPAAARGFCHAEAGLLVAGRTGIAAVVTPVERDLHGMQRRRRRDRRVGGSNFRM